MKDTETVKQVQRFLSDEAATEVLGRQMAQGLRAGLVVYLQGDLGAGKTTLVRALLRGAGVMGAVKSPTYSLVELYPVSNLNLYHFDFYRFNDPYEFVEAGLDDYFDGQGVCWVEWPDKAEGYVPEADAVVRLTIEGEGRRFELDALTERGSAWLSTWIQSVANS